MKFALVATESKLVKLNFEKYSYSVSSVIFMYSVR